jgi:alpha-beta hydrolase superfamily lysophospholipase
MYHTPAAASRAPEFGVVLCNPIGYEAMSVHRSYRHLAEQVSARGQVALRFDYDGTGDSAGRSDDPGRVRAWLESIRTAVAYVRAVSGVRRVALVGVRFGATLATLVSLEDAEIDRVVAWAPVVSGRAQMRELRAFRMIKRQSAPTDGSEEVAGYYFSRETLADLAAIDTTSAGSGSTLERPKRVLVLSQTAGPRGAPDDAKLVAWWKARGAHPTLAADEGYGAMMREDPYDGVVSGATISNIVTWLCEEPVSGEGVDVRRPDRREGADANIDVAPAPASVRPDTVRPDSKRGREVMTLPARNGGTLHETAIGFGDHGSLFGILTELETPPPAGRDRPAICLLNVGANHRVGPHRMNVELARELASLGYVVFRFDVGGLGDSATRPSSRENRLYWKGSVEDVTTAMDLLSEMRGARRFVLVGLCSGAYLAYHAAVNDARVAADLLLSPFAFEWKEGDPISPQEREMYRSTRHYARSLLDKKIWLRALRGDVNLSGIAGELWERLKTNVDDALPAVTAWVRGRRRPQNDVERAFRTMCDRGTLSLIVYSFNDAGLDMIARYLGHSARRMRGRSNFALEVVDGADHTFMRLASQRQLKDIVARYMSTHFP